MKVYPSIINCLAALLLSVSLVACSSGTGKGNPVIEALTGDGGKQEIEEEGFNSAVAIIVSPAIPEPGKPFRIIAAGSRSVLKADITVTGASGSVSAEMKRKGGELPSWIVFECAGSAEGNYKAVLSSGDKSLANYDFKISAKQKSGRGSSVWETLSGWDGKKELLYSAWINALFTGCDENSTWKALHEVTRNNERNFLHNHLGLGEDNPDDDRLVMQPDCADNPFFLRAYFSWKLGLPFGFHICDRGSLSRSPSTGEWHTNEISVPRKDRVEAFSYFLRIVMNGVQSATARTALDNDNSDYYPVELTRNALRPGTVYADPYGHTLIITGWTDQTRRSPGMLLSVDAQPDGTVGIKRFWQGNFLFNTSGVIGEPGFKAFRPLLYSKGKSELLRNKDLSQGSGYVPLSLQQRKMKMDVFYHTIDRLINPKPLDAETALDDLVSALHEQLKVRVLSVANGEEYMKTHPGAVVGMPSNPAAIFQSGGQWEDFSTPNRDLRLLIAIDALLDFPGRIIRDQNDFDLKAYSSPQEAAEKLQKLLEKKTNALSVTYIRSDGSEQELTLGEILKRREAFEVAYNPNDCIETRWGAPAGSSEHSTCHREAPGKQKATMNSVRTWFHKRLHPPT